VRRRPARLRGRPRRTASTPFFISDDLLANPDGFSLARVYVGLDLHPADRSAGPGSASDRPFGDLLDAVDHRDEVAM
jgi:hypothetical protein